MKLIIIALMILATGSCGCSKADDRFESEPISADVKADYFTLSTKLVSDFTIGGFGVVSRSPTGDPRHSGEALIWGGTALWSMPCEAGNGLSAALAAMIDRNNGAMVRVEPIGEYANGRQVSFDGHTGAMLGIARRVIDCGEKELWSGPFQKLMAFQKSNDNRMHPAVEQRIFSEMVYVRELIGFHLGIRDKPDSGSLYAMEKIVGSWALAVQQTKAACFRVNLGLSNFLAVETLKEKISSNGRNYFCQSTEGMKIPTVDHWCGRENIKNYLSSYQANLWEMRHQRCHYESPDGKDNTSPQLDKLVAYSLAYGWHQLQN